MKDRKDRKTAGYFRQLRKQLVPHPDKKRFLADLKNQVDKYLEEDSLRDIEDVRSHFGTPEELNEYFMNTLDADTYRHKVYFSRFFKVCFVLSISIVLAGVLFVVHDYQTSKPATIITETTTIIEKEDLPYEE